MRIDSYINDFFGEVTKGKIELYNEFSLQHELGIFLRKKIGSQCKIQFERNISYFDIPNNLYKKEIDISIFKDSDNLEIVIELKYLINGRVPESIFDSCKDIAFLEELKHNGFKEGYSIIVANSSFHTNGGRKKNDAIYNYFRDKKGAVKKKITGIINKPTGNSANNIEISGSYQIKWKDLINDLKYAIIRI